MFQRIFIVKVWILRKVSIASYWPLVTFFSGWLYVPFIMFIMHFFFLSRRSKDLLLWFTFFDSCLLTKIGENNTGDNDLLADIQPVLTLLWCSIMLLMWTFILFCVYRNAQTILLAICFWRLWPGGGQGRVV